MKRSKQAPRKEKAGAKERFNVVLQADCRQGKYLFAEEADGFSLEHAQALASPAGQRETYSVVPLEVHRWARAQGEPISAQKAVNRFAQEESNG